MLLECGNLYAYGCGWAVQPPVAGTTGCDWVSRVQRRLGVQVGVWGLPWRGVIHAATVALSATGGPFPAPPAGAVWHSAPRAGVVVVDSWSADVVNARNYTAPVPVLYSAGDVAAQVAAWGCLLATVASGGKTEIEAVSPTFQGSAWASTAGAFSGGSILSTTTPGDWVQFTVPGNPSGFVWLILASLDPATVTAAGVGIVVNGTPVSSLPSAGLTVRGVTDTGGTAWWVPTAVKVSIPTSGTNTIRITHQGSGGQAVYADCVLTPARVPVPVLLPQHPAPVAGRKWTTVQAATIAANTITYQTQVLPGPVGAFPNVTWLPTGVAPCGLSTVDGVHLNDRGARVHADDVGAAIRMLADADSLYTTL